MKKVEVDFGDLSSGCDKKMVRRFGDMKDSFLDSGGVEGNPLIYEVFIRDFGGFEMGLNVSEAGDINGEFFMTKGHRHKKNSDEIYILLKGKVKLLIQGKVARVFEMKKGKVYFVPGLSGHRLVNVGNSRAEVLTIYSKDAGHDYGFGFTKRIFKNGFDKKKR